MKTVPGAKRVPSATWMRPMTVVISTPEMQVQAPSASRTKCLMKSCRLSLPAVYLKFKAAIDMSELQYFVNTFWLDDEMVRKAER